MGKKQSLNRFYNSMETITESQEDHESDFLNNDHESISSKDNHSEYQDSNYNDLDFVSDFSEENLVINKPIIDNINTDNYTEACSYKYNSCFKPFDSIIHDDFKAHVDIDKSLEYDHNYDTLPNDKSFIPSYKLFALSSPTDECRMLVKEYSKDNFDQFINDFKAHTKLAGELDCKYPSCVNVSGCMYDQNHYYITYQMSETVKLLNHPDIITRSFDLSNSERLNVLIQMTEKLNEIHKAQLTPMCVNVNNITANEYVCLLDFIGFSNGESLEKTPDQLLETKIANCPALAVYTDKNQFDVVHNDIINLIQVFIFLDPIIRYNFTIKLSKGHSDVSQIINPNELFWAAIYKQGDHKKVKTNLAAIITEACEVRESYVPRQKNLSSDKSRFANYESKTVCSGLQSLYLDVLSNGDMMTLHELAVKLSALTDDDFTNIKINEFSSASIPRQSSKSQGLEHYEGNTFGEKQDRLVYINGLSQPLKTLI